MADDNKPLVPQPEAYPQGLLEANIAPVARTEPTRWKKFLLWVAKKARRNQDAPDLALEAAKAKLEQPVIQNAHLIAEIEKKRAETRVQNAKATKLEGEAPIDRDLKTLDIIERLQAGGFDVTPVQKDDGSLGYKIGSSKAPPIKARIESIEDSDPTQPNEPYRLTDGDGGDIGED